MIAVILAAGISSRLRPLTNTLPKPLLPLAGTPLLHRTLKSLHHCGLQRCVIVTGYYHEMIQQFVRGLGIPLFVDFVFNPRFDSTNNNYSLWTASSQVLGQEMLLLDADILFHEEILGLLLRSPYENALVIRRSEQLRHEEVKVELDSMDRVVRIGKDLDRKHAAGESLGIEKFSRKTTEALFKVLERRKERNEFYEASFQDLIDGGTKLFAVDAGKRPCIEIDTSEDLKEAERLARSMVR
jgi:choline kinase